ncbi:ATP-binding protein [Streptomyces sp. ID05-47C]|uniref:ATP-binding protein n=1 Tax=Streptomyces sp. ID05-47C TaxID=3028665 RepID=UPI0029A12B19|nr:ATP-binding protein [Streptomyces sp. ID05-47C]MDX3571613.1 ATP-binding protein [Streptomyces sp. ID05-47C]
MSGDITGEYRHRSVLPFEAVPAEVRLLRRSVAAQLGQWGVPHSVAEAELVVTEMAANVIKHVGEGVSATLILEWDRERLRVEMHDKNPSLPALQATSCEDECGRGLHLLSALSADWGTVLTAVGKSVWCEIAAPAGRACHRVERAVHTLRSYQGANEATLSTHARRDEVALKESAVELIADLLHWTTVNGHDPDDILDQAQMHFEAEAEAAA